MGVHLLADPMNELIVFSDLCKILHWDQGKVITYMRQLLGSIIGQWLEIYKARTGPWKLSEFAWFEIWSSMLLVSYSKHFCVSFGQFKRTMEVAARESEQECKKLLNPFPFAEDGESQRGPNACPKCGVACNASGDARWCGTCTMIFYKDVEPEKCPICQQVRPCSNSNRSGIQCCYRYHDINQGKKLKEHTRLVWDQKQLRMVPANPVEYAKLIPFAIPDSLDNPRHFGHVFYLWCEFMEKEDRTENRK